jgi:hypothetical protein
VNKYQSQQVHFRYGLLGGTSISPYIIYIYIIVDQIEQQKHYRLI